MPAIGIVAEDITASGTGKLALIGRLQNVDTSAFSEGDTLYIGASGGLTTTAPSGEGNLIQNIGKVTKSNASSGSIIVTGAGRANATPNLNDGNFFLGNASNQAVTTSFNGAIDSHLNTSSAANGEYLSWNGSDYDWASVPPGYANSDVDTHLNTSGASSGQYLGWNGSDYAWSTIDLSTQVSRSGDSMTGFLTLHADPTNALHAATKEYVDTIAAAGIHYHTPVRVESPDSAGNLNATYNNGSSGVGATLTNAGTQAALVIDGVTLNTNDRVLIYNQTNAYENGIYTVTNTGSASTNWVLTRATDADSYGASDPDAFGEGDAFFVKEGDTGAGELYVMNTSGTITFGTTAITFTVIAETAVYSAGDSLTLTGTVFDAIQDIRTSASPTFAGTTINGNITVTGTVDGRDVATDGTKLDTIATSATANPNAIDNVVEDTTPQLGGDLASNGNDILFADNDKAIFGAGSDLQIYHDPSNNHSFIKEAGTGDLRILGDNISLRSTSTDEPYINITTNGAVNLYYDNSSKLTTTSTGVNITGTLTSDGLTVEQSGNDVSIVSRNTSNNASVATSSSLKLGITSTVGTHDSEIKVVENAVNSNTTRMEFYNYFGGTLYKNMSILGNGDISFYEDTGTTAKFFWDASAERLGIGTDSPSAVLHAINSASSGESIAILEASATKNGYVYINGDDNRRKSLVFQSGGVNKFSMGVGDSDELSADSFFIGSGLHGGSGADLVIDSSGNVGIGEDSPSSKLHISQATDALASGLQIRNAADTSSLFIYQDGIDTKYDTGTSGSQIFRTNSAERMRIDSTGVTSDGLIKNVANNVTASGATTTIDMTASNFHVITMNASTTFSLSNLASAITSSGTLVIKQDATGGRSFTLPSSCKTPVGGASIVQHTGANSTSILSYIVVSSTEVLVNYVGNFA